MSNIQNKYIIQDNYMLIFVIPAFYSTLIYLHVCLKKLVLEQSYYTYSVRTFILHI